MVVIFDIGGLALRQVRHRSALDMVARLAAIYEANYPETLGAALVVNVSV